MQEKNQYPYAEIRNFNENKRTRSFQKENDDNGNSLSSSDDEFTPKYKKRFRPNKIPSSMNLWSGNVVIFWRRMD